MNQLKIFLLGLCMIYPTQAMTQFGLSAVSDGGAGVILLTETVSSSILYSTINNRTGVDEDETNIEFNIKYRQPLDTNNHATFGIKYVMNELKTVDDDDSDENTVFALTAGLEHALSKRILLQAETDVYSHKTIDDGDDEQSLFNYARLGISFLF